MPQKQGHEPWSAHTCSCALAHLNLQICLFMARLEDPTSKMILSVLLTAGGCTPLSWCLMSCFHAPALPNAGDCLASFHMPCAIHQWVLWVFECWLVCSFRGAERAYLCLWLHKRCRDQAWQLVLMPCRHLQTPEVFCVCGRDQRACMHHYKQSAPSACTDWHLCFVGRHSCPTCKH